MREDYGWHRARLAQRRQRRKPAFATALVGVIALGAAFGLSLPGPKPLVDGVGQVATLASRSGAMLGIGRFGLCHTGGGINCVVDGDTFWMDGVKIRVADIDTPETHPPRCAEESDLGDRATRRFQELLNAGPVTLAPIDRDEDIYGRKLRLVMRDGESLGDTLIAEGLARPWEGHRRPWCFG